MMVDFKKISIFKAILFLITGKVESTEPVKDMVDVQLCIDGRIRDSSGSILWEPMLGEIPSWVNEYDLLLFGKILDSTSKLVDDITIQITKEQYTHQLKMIKLA